MKKNNITSLRNNGFTLVEVVVTLALMAVVLSINIPVVTYSVKALISSKKQVETHQKASMLAARIYKHVKESKGNIICCTWNGGSGMLVDEFDLDIRSGSKQHEFTFSTDPVNKATCNKVMFRSVHYVTFFRTYGDPDKPPYSLRWEAPEQVLMDNVEDCRFRSFVANGTEVPEVAGIPGRTNYQYEFSNFNQPLILLVTFTIDGHSYSMEINPLNESLNVDKRIPNGPRLYVYDEYYQ